MGLLGCQTSSMTTRMWMVGATIGNGIHGTDLNVLFFYVPGRYSLAHPPPLLLYYYEYYYYVDPGTTPDAVSAVILRITTPPHFITPQTRTKDIYNTRPLRLRLWSPNTSTRGFTLATWTRQLHHLYIESRT